MGLETDVTTVVPNYFNGFKCAPAPVAQDEAPAAVLTGLVILNSCNEVEQRIQFSIIGDD